MQTTNKKALRMQCFGMVSWDRNMPMHFSRLSECEHSTSPKLAPGEFLRIHFHPPPTKKHCECSGGGWLVGIEICQCTSRACRSANTAQVRNSPPASFSESTIPHQQKGLTCVRSFCCEAAIKKIFLRFLGIDSYPRTFL